MDLPFRDREVAGDALGRELARLELDGPLVLAVPRGGVLVGRPVARALGGELDLIVVRKIGAPGNPELGVGAVGAEGEPYLDERAVSMLRVPKDYLLGEIERQRREVRRRLVAYRGDRPLPRACGRDVVVVDDGIATGGTVAAAGRLLRAQEPARLVLAVPVAPAEGIERVRPEYDDVVCVATPAFFLAVGQWYADFHQVTDEEVRSCIREAA